MKVDPDLCIHIQLDQVRENGEGRPRPLYTDQVRENGEGRQLDQDPDLCS